MEKEIYELIIIGGGPAGLTAAVYAARKKIKALLLAKDIGGQVVWTSTIENYMGYQFVEGLELMNKFELQLKQFPLETRPGEEAASVSRIGDYFEIKTTDGDVFHSKAVIIATGKHPRRLEVPGEKELTGRGVSYCSVCDGPLFAEMKVAVIGGGNSALEAVDDMLVIADQVYSVMEGDYTGDAVLVDRVKQNPKISIFRDHKVLEIQGNNRVESIVIQNVRTGEKQTLPVQGVFVEIGLSPNSGPVKNLVRLNANSEIEVNCNTETGVPGLYAAGDVASTPEKQIIIAAGDGAKASLQAHRYLQRLG
jgi:alkyl hydroperoxide reductase subunit F